MTESDERRVKGVSRIPVSTLVEVCGNDPGTPAFEAESVDVSGRGMHVRTAYLPEEGAPLVCRFEDQGREIVVEGLVAWRREGVRGGEFGIKFTALDSGSVDALRDLCDAGAAPSEPEVGPAPPSELEPEAARASAEPGGRVRLHIEGLGAPMKARIRDGGTHKVHVGSNLEFLKVGRHLDIEDLEQGGKRGAVIDAVDVVVDPSSQIPQLVVALRFDDAEETTPEPSVIDSSEVAPRAPTPRFERAAFSASASTDDDDEPSDVDDVIEDASAFKTKLGGVAENAGAVARGAGAMMSKAGGKAARGLGQLFKGASAKVADYRAKRAGADTSAPRRTTAPPPSGVLSSQAARLRPQSSPRVDAVAPAPSTPPWKTPRGKKIAAASGLLVLLLTVVALATHKSSAPPGDEAPAAAKTVAVNGDVQQVDEQGNPIAAAAESTPIPGKTLANAPSAPTDSAAGATADVPLFGATPMATMEPAPLGAAPDPLDSAGLADAPQAAAPALTEEQQEMEAAKDESFPDAPPAPPPTAKKSATRPQDVHPWGRGKVRTPTVHRLRLDGPGAAIQGVVTATGFTVVIPGRKVMETGAAIKKRDSRIARVRTSTSGSGAQISFQFKDGVPGYRVRLRRDFVEFLISAPGKDDGVSSAKHEKSTKASKKKGAHSDQGAKTQSGSTAKKSQKKARK
ncbi:MAG: PilZ domain-containing protein [Sorangiineae bacterium]|nr:PilZ domain-containing protein [Polyangiaceae bacterium]MEB2322237.1 PilZ domain-containing protein [Sorangiineae bacterium]